MQTPVFDVLDQNIIPGIIQLKLRLKIRYFNMIHISYHIYCLYGMKVKIPRSSIFSPLVCDVLDGGSRKEEVQQEAAAFTKRLLQSNFAYQSENLSQDS